MTTEEEIRKFVDAGYKSKFIAETLGLAEGTVLRYMAQMPKPTTQQPHPGTYLAGATVVMRAKLADLLVDMRSKLSPREVARRTGVNQRQQILASNRPYQYDWKLSQINRMLNHNSLEMKDII